MNARNFNYDTAVRMIHFYFNRLGQPNKKKVITRHDGYHGSTYMAMPLTGVEFDHGGYATQSFAIPFRPRAHAGLRAR